MAGIDNFPLVLNPPFATCQTDVTRATGFKLQAQDNVALYIMKGTMNANEVSGNKLTVLLTADLNQQDIDLAKIVKANGNNANNPALVANLIANENHNNAKRIDFTLTDVNTDCKQISFTDNTIFRPITGELG
jgi:hypothetical protein